MILSMSKIVQVSNPLGISSYCWLVSLLCLDFECLFLSDAIQGVRYIFGSSIFACFPKTKQAVTFPRLALDP